MSDIVRVRSRSLRPLLLSVVPGNERQIDKLRRKRLELQGDISALVNELGPQLFDDFKRTRIVPTSAAPPPTPTIRRKRSSYGQGGQGTFLTHPLGKLIRKRKSETGLTAAGWLDEVLFGWSESSKRPFVEEDSSYDDEQSGGQESGYTSDEPDYDQVRCATELSRNLLNHRARSYTSWTVCRDQGRLPRAMLDLLRIAGLAPAHGHVQNHRSTGRTYKNATRKTDDHPWLAQ